ncbi:MAG: hypothetical protein R6V19_01840 [Armatimonadota bacterium]
MPSDLHEKLQQYYSQQDDDTEVPVSDFRADVLIEDTIYEIQTRNLSAIRDKLLQLVSDHDVVLVMPLAETKHIVYLDPESGEELRSRRSPKHCTFFDAFDELVYLTRFLPAGRGAVELVLTEERELRVDDGEGSWRRDGISIQGRELVEVIETRRFETPADFLSLLPQDLPHRFTTADIAEVCEVRTRLAGRIAYTLRESGAITHVGNKGKAYLYERA